jgi:hypothetical protein
MSKPNTKSARKAIEDDYNRAITLALHVVEVEARAILQAHKNLDEFIMGMGRADFTLKKAIITKNFVLSAGDYVDAYELKYLKPFYKFLNEWDDYLKLTDNPMRFTADGPKITNW